SGPFLVRRRYNVHVYITIRLGGCKSDSSRTVRVKLGNGYPFLVIAGNSSPRSRCRDVPTRTLAVGSARRVAVGFGTGSTRSARVILADVRRLACPQHGEFPRQE